MSLPLSRDLPVCRGSLRNQRMRFEREINLVSVRTDAVTEKNEAEAVGPNTIVAENN
jgi:hypothetical protein